MINNELKDLWERRLAEYEISGKSIAAWCGEQSIRVNQFYYWRKKLRLGQAAKDQTVEWLTLGLEQAILAPDSIAIHISQVTVEIRRGFDQQLLREIVQVLQT